MNIVNTNCRIGFAHIGRVGSVVFTVSISVERYLNCTYPNDKLLLKAMLVPIPVIFTLLYNIPKFFELTSCTHQPLLPQKFMNDTKPLDFISHPQNDSSSDVSTILSDYSSMNYSSTKIIPFVISSNQSFGNVSGIPFQDLSKWTKLDVKTDPVDEDDSDLCEEGYKPTYLRSNWWYIVLYLFWSKFLFVEFVPWISVIVLTICTTKTLKNFHNNRNRLLGSNRRQQTTDEGTDLEINCLFFYI